MKRLLTGAAIAATLATGALYAGHGGGMDRGFPGGCKSERGMDRHGAGEMRLLSDLDLSASQRKEIRKIMFDHHEAMLELREDNAPTGIVLDKSGNLDKAQFIKQANKNHEAMVEKRAEMLQKILGVLNETQKKELTDKLEKLNKRS